MARRGENIYRRKDGRWEGRYKNGFKPDGKTKYASVYGKSYSEVRSVLIQKRMQIREEMPICRLKFGEIIQAWLKSIKNTVKESTYANYLMKTEKHILPRIGGILYDKLTAEILNDFVAERIESGLSANMFRIFLCLLSQQQNLRTVNTGMPTKLNLCLCLKNANLMKSVF